MRRSDVKKILMLGIVIAAMIFLASCATAPKKEAPKPEKQVGTPPEAEYSEAKGLRATIMKYGLSQFAQDEFNTAEIKFKEGETAYKSDVELSRDSFEKAILGYKTVLDIGFPAYLDDKIAEVEKIKKAGEDIKSPVAVKDEYKSAKSVYDDALKSKKKGDYEEASGLLDKAKDQFQSVYDVTLAKKEKAEQNLDEANAMIEELEAAAAQE
jgi:tetratricopeptide (TPR) repeat protein